MDGFKTITFVNLLLWAIDDVKITTDETGRRCRTYFQENIHICVLLTHGC